MNYKAIIDWFLNKGRSSQVIIIFLLIITYLGYNYYKNQEILAVNVTKLENKVEEQEILIDTLNKEIQTYKINSILYKANEDRNPTPMWLADVKTGTILWVNKAYEKKYLLPKFTNREEFMGTDGSYVFGEEEVNKFKANNRMIFMLQRPKTFRDEVNASITKFPVRIGSYTYAIGGIEYINFD